MQSATWGNLVDEEQDIRNDGSRLNRRDPIVLLIFGNFKWDVFRRLAGVRCKFAPYGENIPVSS
jgi:hypothetical protein